MTQKSPDHASGEGDPTLPPGTRIGEYVVQELIGEGGFGAVFRAVHPVIGKSAAVKVLKKEFSAKPEMVARFISEARAVNQIRHRNIIDIFSFGKLEDSRQYYVMELLDGKPLDKYLDQHHKLPLTLAIPMLRQLGRALGAAHAAGITHRDIKPENVFLTFDDDSQPIPKLLDFGIAKLVVDNSSQHNTRSGVPMGTPLYMSPEQVHGKDVDHRSDIYSFGILVFQTLTGKMPFTGESMMDVMMKQVQVAPPRPSAVDPSLPPGLDAAILKMLEKDPAMRPNGIVEAVDELAQAAVRIGAVSLPGATPVGLDPLPMATPSSSSSPSARLMAQTPGKPPGELTIAAFGASDTLVASEKFPSTTPGQLPSKRPTLAIVGAIAAALGIAGTVAFFATRSPSPGSAPAALMTQSAAEPAQSAASATGPEIAPASATAAPATSTAPTAALPTTVKLRVNTKPEGAEVWNGKEKLGNAGEELALPRGDKEIVLTIKKPGFTSQQLKLTPDQDRAEAVILTATPKARSEFGEF